MSDDYAQDCDAFFIFISQRLIWLPFSALTLLVGPGWATRRASGL